MAAPGIRLGHRPLVIVLLALIALLGGVLRVDAVGSATRVSVDERSYLGIANNLAVHGSYAYGSDPRHWAPGAPMFFAAVMKLTGTGPASNEPGRRTAVLYGQAAISTAAILAVFGFASWIGGAWAGLAAALATTVYDPLILAGRSYLTESLGGLLLLLAVSVLCLAVAQPRRRIALSIGAGALLGLTVLTRNDMLLLIGLLPAVTALVLWKVEAWRPALTTAAITAAAAVATVSPWITYASLEERKFTPVTTAGPSSLWVATYLPAGGRQIIVKRQFMDEVCRTFPDRQDACGVTATEMDMRLVFELLQRRHPGKTVEEAVQLELDRNIRQYALGQPLAYVRMLASKSTRIWGKPWGGGAVGRQESSIWEHRLLIGVAALGLVFALFAAGGRRRYVVIAATALFAVTALNTVFVSESRMSLRMTPLLLAVGIGGLGAAIATVHARRRDETGPRVEPA